MLFAGVALTFATRPTDSAPPAPNVTLSVPAATACPLLVVNSGHEINRVPSAGDPSARYTTSLIVVNGGDCPQATDAVSSTNKKSRLQGRHTSRINFHSSNYELITEITSVQP